ncbi:hypothetical protein [Paraburkholderia sp.]|uniref:hypothetical protein n=1 Tax=Paraburkholderia sp. TaxID=1926495 RepID=UPI0025E1B7E3|nr:hypothetical protein [Paraburkholderia sp.]
MSDESAAFRRTESELQVVREQGTIECGSRDACTQTWHRTQAFVEQHSPTPIDLMTDDEIETRMPREFRLAYFWAVRQVGVDGTTTIRLKGMCRGMYDSNGGPGWIYMSCARQLREVQLEFRREVGGNR